MSGRNLLSELKADLEVTLECHMAAEADRAGAALRMSDRHIEALEYQIKSLEDPDT